MKDAKHWLESIEPVTDEELTGDKRDEVLKLLGNSGFATLCGLMIAERQGYYQTLAHLNLSDPGQLRAASVIQGQIKAIDRLRETMLELLAQANPTEDGDN